MIFTLVMCRWDRVDFGGWILVDWIRVNGFGCEVFTILSFLQS